MDYKDNSKDFKRHNREPRQVLLARKRPNKPDNRALVLPQI